MYFCIVSSCDQINIRIDVFVRKSFIFFFQDFEYQNITSRYKQITTKTYAQKRNMILAIRDYLSENIGD